MNAKSASEYVAEFKSRIAHRRLPYKASCHEKIQPATILIADDDRMSRSFLRAILEKDGHLIFEAAGGEEAVAVALQMKPDIILLDVMMPDKDGWQVLVHEQENHHRFRRHAFAPVTAEKLRVRVLATHGHEMQARVYQVRVPRS